MHVYRRVECFFILTHLHIIYLDHTLRFAAMMSFKTHPGVRERVFKIVIKTLTVPTKCDRIHVYRRVSCSLSWHTYISSTSTTPNVKCDVSQIWLFKLKTYTIVIPCWKIVTVPTKCDWMHVYRRVSCSLSWHNYISSTSSHQMSNVMFLKSDFLY